VFSVSLWFFLLFPPLFSRSQALPGNAFIEALPQALHKRVNWRQSLPIGITRQSLVTRISSLCPLCLCGFFITNLHIINHWQKTPTNNAYLKKEYHHNPLTDIPSHPSHLLSSLNNQHTRLINRIFSEFLTNFGWTATP